MKLTCDAAAMRSVHTWQTPLDEDDRLLIERLQAGLWIVLAAMTLFGLADLRLMRAVIPALALVKLVQAVIVVAGLVVLRGHPPRRFLGPLGVLLAGAIYITAAASAVVRQDYLTTTLLLVGGALGTAALIPWGALAQLCSVVVAALALLVNLALVSGNLDAALGHHGLGVLIAFGGSVYVAYEHDRHRRERARVARLLGVQQQILQMIATDAALPAILDTLTSLVESQAPDMLCSVLLLDGDRLRHGAGPSLPEAYNQAIDGLVIGPDVGSCGSAAYRGQPVIVSDIARDPRWEPYRHLALDHGLRACWSAPIINTDGRCLGTFAMYYRAPRSPAAHDWALIEIATDLARVAIERSRTAAALAASRQRLEEESRVTAALVRVGQEMLSAQSTPLILERLCRLTTELLECECSDTLLREAHHEDAFVVSSAHGYSPEDGESLRLLRLPSTLLAPILTTLERTPVVQVRTAAVADPTSAGLLRRLGITFAMHVALRRGKEIVGVLSAACRGREQIFTPLQERIALGIAQLASLALENARLLEELKHASQLKSEFVSTMSHELRTPLNVILGYSDMLADEPDEHTRRSALAAIRNSSLELLEMIDATLNLNRIEAGKDQPCLETFALSKLWEELAGEFAAPPRKAEVELRWQSVDGLELYTDRRKLKIIVKNLVGNALKFTPRGSVVVSCERTGGAVVLAVRDTGVGIPADHLPVIFDMFRQVDSSDARSYSGAGLGLYIVRRLLTQLGGEIAVASERGRGSTFTVRLPAEAAAHALRATAWP